jgi:hypothetical protein
MPAAQRYKEARKIEGRNAYHLLIAAPAYVDRLKELIVKLVLHAVLAEPTLGIGRRRLFINYWKEYGRAWARRKACSGKIADKILRGAIAHRQLSLQFVIIARPYQPRAG